MATNIEELQQKIHTAMKEERDAAPKMSALAEYTSVFSVENEGSIDESFTIEMDGIEVYDEDAQGSAVCDEFYGSGKDEVLDKLALTHHSHVDDIMEEIPDSVDEETLKKIRRTVAREIALARAKVVLELNYNINETLFGRIEDRIEKIVAEYPGVEYKGWEEISLEFEIDGDRYTMYAWEGELTKWEPIPKRSEEKQ